MSFSSTNRTTLITCLQSAMDDYILGSSSAVDVLSQSLTASTLGEINILTVADVNSLPNLELYDSPDAILCFLRDLDVFVISSNKRWITLDGRVMRDDSGVLPGFVWAWGLNSTGQLGDDTVTSRRSPVSVVGGITTWCQVSASNCHTVAVTTSGDVWAWGFNSVGQLGDDTVTSRRSPVSVVGGISTWCQVSGGGYHTVAVTTSGDAWAWGCNGQGRLGDNTATNRSAPVSIVGGITTWCQTSAGGFHTVAVTSMGDAWAWGSNGGQLGDNTTTNRSSPVSVVGGITSWCQIHAGCRHTVAVTSMGDAWAWGCNVYGQLGDNTVTNRSSPVSVVGGISDWCQISGGGCHTVAITTSGDAWAWGLNGMGQLGDNTVTNRSSPVSVVGGISTWCQISGGGYHTAAVTTSGDAWAWGYNIRGQLGDNTTTNRSSPVSVVGGISDWCQISGGRCHTVSLRVISC
jgi:alpha-tubulin suppressor-like RCC1 family protein